MSDRVSFRAVYERFPVAIKGAFVLRGADGEPHQVRLDTAWVNECAGRSSERLLIEPTILEVAPTLDTFVPFEIPILDLDPGWYGLEVEAAIDGVAIQVLPGERFSIGWPRGAVRRGSLDIGRGAGDVTVRSLECTGDSIRIIYEAPEVPVVRLSLDGVAHTVVDVEHEAGATRGRVIAYPALRDQSVLSIQVEGAAPLEVRLP